MAVSKSEAFVARPIYCMRADNRRVIVGELFQSELFWRVIFMQIRLLKMMNFGSLQSQLSSNT